MTRGPYDRAVNRRALASVLGVGIVGSQAGHVLAYGLRFGDTAQAIQSSGVHAYFPALAKTAVGAAALAARRVASRPGSAPGGLSTRLPAAALHRGPRVVSCRRGNGPGPRRLCPPDPSTRSALLLLASCSRPIQINRRKFA